MIFSKKMWLTLLLSIIANLFVCADTPKLILHHPDGTTTEVELYVMPVITLNGDHLMVTSDIVNLEFAQADVVRFTYSGIEKSTGIVGPKSDVVQQDDRLVFKRVKPGDKIAIYTTDGKQVPIKPTMHGTDAVLPLSALKGGIYLLKVNDRTSKFTKR